MKNIYKDNKTQNTRYEQKKMSYQRQKDRRHNGIKVELLQLSSKYHYALVQFNQGENLKVKIYKRLQSNSSALQYFC